MPKSAHKSSSSKRRPLPNSKCFREKVGKVLHEYKGGNLHMGKSGKYVGSRKQAVAIAISEARKKCRD